MKKDKVYKLPASGEAREILRQTGQFWTPDWVAEAMVEYVLVEQNNLLFDPAVGAGAFFRAGKTVAKENGMSVSLLGMEVDVSVLEQAIEQGLTRDDLAGVQIRDFVFCPISEKLPAIVANPPYIRHHRISVSAKKLLRQLSLQIVGKLLDGRAGLHVYFLIRSLSVLKENGRLAFILPADTCEGKFATILWHWICANYALDAVVTFSPNASPFPKVDTNPVILFIHHAKPQEQFIWAKCHETDSDSLKQWVKSGFEMTPGKNLTVVRRDLSEGLNTGLSRPPIIKKISSYVLGDFAQVVRGIATGANDFFFLTEEQVKNIGIPANYLIRAVGRTRDVPDSEITQDTLVSLCSKGRPTFLLSLNGEPYENYPETVKQYLATGEALGLQNRPLISQRKPWYKMESRTAPPFLFAYLGRRSSRFIRNVAQIVPLTGFLCVYPLQSNQEYHNRLWNVLNHPDTLANLPLVGKSYGDGAIKVEPRSLEKLPIPDHLLAELGLPMQMRLFEPKPSDELFTSQREDSSRT